MEQANETRALPPYEPPQVISYTDEDILGELGAAWTMPPSLPSPIQP